MGRAKGRRMLGHSVTVGFALPHTLAQAAIGRARAVQIPLTRLGAPFATEAVRLMVGGGQSADLRRAVDELLAQVRAQDEALRKEDGLTGDAVPAGTLPPRDRGSNDAPAGAGGWGVNTKGRTDGESHPEVADLG